MFESIYFILNLTQTGSCQVSGYLPHTFSTLDNTFSFRKHYHFKSLQLIIVCLSHFLFPVASLPSVIMNIASQPYERGIYCQDESIGYPLRPDTISHVTMAVVTITCTIIIVSPSFIDISIMPSMISSSHESRADSQESVRSWLCTAERFIMHNNTALCARGLVSHIYDQL